MTRKTIILTDCKNKIITLSRVSTGYVFTARGKQNRIYRAVISTNDSEGGYWMNIYINGKIIRTFYSPFFINVYSWGFSFVRGI